MLILLKNGNKITPSVEDCKLRGLRIRSVTFDAIDVKVLNSMPESKLRPFLSVLNMAMFKPLLKDMIVPDDIHELRALKAGKSAKCSMRMVEVDENGDIIDYRYP